MTGFGVYFLVIYLLERVSFSTKDSIQVTAHSSLHEKLPSPRDDYTFLVIHSQEVNISLKSVLGARCQLQRRTKLKYIHRRGNTGWSYALRSRVRFFPLIRRCTRHTGELRCKSALSGTSKRGVRSVLKRDVTILQFFSLRLSRFHHFVPPSRWRSGAARWSSRRGWCKSEEKKKKKERKEADRERAKARKNETNCGRADYESLCNDAPRSLVRTLPPLRRRVLNATGGKLFFFFLFAWYSNDATPPAIIGAVPPSSDYCHC